MGCIVTQGSHDTVVMRRRDTPLRGVEVDMADVSDLVPTLAVVATTAAICAVFVPVAFTGGIGENAAPIRARILEGCAWLGATLDAAANAAHAPRITTAQSRLAAHVIPTNEEGIIAAQTLSLTG